jgi:UDP-N-acetylmuramoyl-tripeptide--D-alanyl-D-alanine ligase
VSALFGAPVATVGTVATDPTGWPAWVVVVLAGLALVPAGLRWLRVSQREHYLPGATLRFAVRWWTDEPVNVLLVTIGAASVVLSVFWPVAAAAAAVVAAVGPIHLSVRGRTAPLVATRRARTLAASWLAAEAVVVTAGALGGVPAPVAGAAVLAVPVLVDVAARLLSPVERHLSNRFVRAAAERLATVGPTVVGVTGSYGKTSTKMHIAHLLGDTRSVVASPASFNNRGGLARAVNEGLADGTEVFVAEMGTYGPGEIADLCRWCPPAISVITAIGPVHLERFRSEDRIVTAKAEILVTATTVVLNVDDDRLAALADRVARDPAGPRVLRCSAVDPRADVCVRRDERGVSLVLAGEAVATDVAVPVGVQPTNLACAVAVALALGVTPGTVVDRLRTLPDVRSRLTAMTAPSGVQVLDDTFNSNPAGARAALDLLAEHRGPGRRVVVTPGMVELGPRQATENEALARRAREVATDLLVVGRSNRRALEKGATGSGSPDGWSGVVRVRRREEAVAWVRDHLGPGDLVLYENDLPDHYP